MSSCSVEARKSNLLNLIYIQKGTKNPEKRNDFENYIEWKISFSFLHAVYGISTFTIYTWDVRELD